ncbi:MAG: dipeptidase [Prolixibacteraceae bacterium]|nr:dipeptidase [Prolixibacteraceae bacterium]
MTNFFSDLHCHTTLFTYNRQYPTPWYERYFPIFPAQGDFSQLARGRVRVVMTSIYPIEQGFVDAKPLGMGTGNLTDFLAKVLVNIPKERSDEIQDYNHEYFDDLKKELRFMQDWAMPKSRKIYLRRNLWKRFRYKIVHNFDDLKNLLNLDDNLNMQPGENSTIAVVLTVEGAHALGAGQKNTLYENEVALKNKVLNNIKKLKKLGPPGHEGAWCPFFLTLSHFFWNQSGGHSVGLYGVIPKVIDQSGGINEGITELGKSVVKALLSTENGERRILIDCEHMSYKVRKWYYNYLSQLDEKIPVIISHTAVNGKATMEEAEMHGNPEEIFDVADKLYAESTDFNPWDDFVSDDEIMIVHNSEGLIGLIMDQRILTGREKLNQTKKNACFKTPRAQRTIWANPFVDQILYIAGHILDQTGQPEKIWDNISLGTDFNGMITPLKPFNTATKLPAFRRALIRVMKKRAAHEATLAGKTEGEIIDIVDRVLWKNNLKFLEKHFH